MMERILCIWWEDWALRRPDAPSVEPCLVVDRHEVVAVNDLARQAGARPGMRRREGEALCPSGIVLERDRQREATTFERVVRQIEDLVPRVEIIDPGLVLVEISGALRFYGGERKLLDLIQKELDGDRARFGVAHGAFASRLAAMAAEPGEVVVVDDDASFLATQDVSVLGNRDVAATFRWLGITTLGELSRLPRATVTSRFGEAGLEAHRSAAGEAASASPRPVPEETEVVESYEDPLDTLDRVGFAARSLAHQLVDNLRRMGSAAHRIEVEAVTEQGDRRTRVWRSADPFTEEMLAERVWWQLRAWIDTGGVRSGIVRLRLAPADVSGSGRQLGFLEDTAATIEAERALARVQTLVGPEQVLGARPQGGRTPAERVQWHRWGEEPEHVPNQAPWPGATPSPAPALIPPDRPLLEIEWDDGMPVRVRLRSRWEPVLNWAGPWRQTGRWWKDETTVDQYQLVTSAGALLCEVYEGNAWLVGVYD